MVELHCHSCYSFLDGASHPEELVARAVELGYTALALTDHNGLYGSLEFAQAAHNAGLQPITGAEVTLEDESHLTLLAETAEGYANLCRLLSMAHRGTHGDDPSKRLHPRLAYADLAEHTAGLIALSGCRKGQIPQLLEQGQWSAAEAAACRYREGFGEGNFYLELQQTMRRHDTQRMRDLAVLGCRLDLPLVATNNTHYHVHARHRLQDTLVAIRHGVTLRDAARYRHPNGELHLLASEAWQERFARYPEALENAREIAGRCRSFDITRDLGYKFPEFIRDAEDDQFLTADQALKKLCLEALEIKYARESPKLYAEAQQWLANELRLVALHNLAGFFLVYRDLLQKSKEVAAEIRGTAARGKFDLPPGRGRGSAVSSIICYLIGLSPIDPVKARLFPGRFLNETLSSIPDIDLDFPRDIREKLIRDVHEHYGKDHVAMVCIFPTYRFRGAVREVGKALALPAAELDRLAKLGDNHTHVGKELQRLAEFSPYQENRLWQHLCELSEQLWGMPRHLSQHVGGVVISSRPLVEIVPVEHSAMEGRQVCQWDKDSVDAARMIKIDFLALGMLSAVEECLDLIAANGKEPLDLSRINYRDKKIFDHICTGDTVGAFQIESRAQIGMLVRTQPRTMEDLAVQVAIVRPGPVVADSVNPYVHERERQRTDPDYRPRFAHPLLKGVLADTLGVIIYQDQVMEVCKHLAGFTDGQADQLRRAMSRKRSRENMERFRKLFLEGAAEKGVPEEVAFRVFEKVIAFSEFGFPKSHAAAFGLLAYQSMWLLHNYPAEFVAALLNNQPMGFYSPDTLIKDAKRRKVEFLAPDINRSTLSCTVQGMTVQLGLRVVQGVGKSKGAEILAVREAGGPFLSLTDFIRRTRMPDRVIENLVLVGAMDGFGLNRRELLWQLGLLGFHRGEQCTRHGVPIALQPALELPTEQDQVALAPAGAWERMQHSYQLMDLSVEAHPLGLLRGSLPRHLHTIAQLRQCADQTMVEVAGLVTTRQRPHTAKGILFLLLEDETGMLNVVVRPELFEQHRQLYRSEPLLIVRGVLERRDLRPNLVAHEAWPLAEALPDAVKSPEARRIHAAIRSFHAPGAHNFH